MKAENFVKKEAKETLGKGNWVKGILSVFVNLFVPMIAVLITEIAYSFVIDGDEVSEELLQNEPARGVIFAVFTLLSVLSVVFLSPLFCGSKRVFSSMAYGVECRAEDIFYFFEEKNRYFQAVKFNLSIAVRSLSVLIISLIPGTAVYAADENLAILAVIFMAAGVLFTVCFVHRYNFASVLFCYHGYTPQESLRVGADSAKQSVKSLIKLTVSFLLWILSLFFVVPFIFVLPYMSCAYCVSVKYLFTAQGMTFETNNISDNSAEVSTISNEKINISENVNITGSYNQENVNIMGSYNQGNVNTTGNDNFNSSESINSMDSYNTAPMEIDDDVKTVILEDKAVTDMYSATEAVEENTENSPMYTLTESVTAAETKAEEQQLIEPDLNKEPDDTIVSVSFSGFAENDSGTASSAENKTEQ